MSHLIKGFAAAATIAIVATSSWTSHARAEVTGPGAWMGVKVMALSEGWREEYSYNRAGVRVTEVEPDGAADRIGIVPGDILVAVGTTSLRKADDLATAQSRADPNEPVAVVIARHNGSMVKIRNMEPVPVPESASAPDADESAGAAPTPATESEATPKPVAAAAIIDVPAPAKAEAPATDAASVVPAPDPLVKLGLQCANLNKDLATALGAPRNEGVLVVQVVPGGNADRAGIKAGDVVTAAGKDAVGSVDVLAHALLAAPAGITLHTLRHTDERDVLVSLTPPTEQEAVQQELRKLREEIEALRAQMGAKSGQ